MIVIDDNEIKLGSVLLPGLIKSIEVDSEITTEDVEIEGRKEKLKQCTGYADGKIFIELTLRGDTEDAVNNKMKTLNNLFRQPNNTVPTVYNIVNKHVNSRGINQVILKKITSKESTGKEYFLTVSLEFFEYTSFDIIAIKKSDNSSSNPASSSAGNYTQAYLTYLENKVTPACDIFSPARKILSKFDHTI